MSPLSSEEMSKSTTIVPTRSDQVLVVAPATLEAGSTFEAEVDGITFIVTVPDDGVHKGWEFQVPYPDKVAMFDDVPIVEATPALASSLSLPDTGKMEDITTVNENSNTSSNYHTKYEQQPKNKVVAFSVPTGQWRRDFCSCFNDFSWCVCLMGWCCSPIMMGQVIQRLKLNWFGCPVTNSKNGQKGNEQPSKPICIIFTILTLLLFVIGVIVQHTLSPTLVYVGCIITVIIGVYFIIAFTYARKSMRERYNLPHTCCDVPGLDDCCSTYWCGCCSAIQMHRHTHDETKYTYNVVSQTGLDDNAPQIV